MLSAQQTNQAAFMESCVLGAILLDNGNLSLLPALESDDFAHWPARVVFEAARTLEASGSPIDVATLGAEVTRVEKLDAIGGYQYLGELVLNVPVIDRVLEYAKRIREAALARRVAIACGEVIELVRSDPQSGGVALSELLQRCARLGLEQPAEVSTIWQVVQRRLRQLQQIDDDRADGKTGLSGFPTGVTRLDEGLGGWQRGIVSIVAARPGCGKSSLGMATADACSAAGVGVHIFSLEDTEESYADRAMARFSSVPAENIRNRDLTRGHLDALGKGFRDLQKRGGWIIDPRSALTAEEIVRSVRRKLKENNTGVAIVDYIQLVQAGANGRRGESTHEALTRIITTFADAAKQDKIAYVVMSQLSRRIEERADKRPLLSDLRESGSLEERAKCVVGMYRGALYGKEPVEGVDYPKGQAAPDDEEFRRTCKLLVLKNSNGRTGEFDAQWWGPTMRLS